MVWGQLSQLLDSQFAKMQSSNYAIKTRSTVLLSMQLEPTTVLISRVPLRIEESSYDQEKCS